jgi:hypothetical protein
MGLPAEKLDADLQASAVVQDRCIGATTERERALGTVLADLLKVERLSVDSHFFCYRAQAGRIEIGPVTLGRDTRSSETVETSPGAE